MHRFSNSSSIFRFRLASILWLLKFPITLYALLFLFKAVITHQGENESAVPLALLVLGFAILLNIVQSMMGSRCRCPLCLGQPLNRTGAVRRSNVPRLLGSYRLRMIVSSIFKGYFRCPYCGEPVAMEVRERRRHRSSELDV